MGCDVMGWDVMVMVIGDLVINCDKVKLKA